ncbi:MAG: ATP-binding protein [Oligoflexia bacterium]|nr:ATP-binding protein [Oligoflexia bacterium]
MKQSRCSPKLLLADTDLRTRDALCGPLRDAGWSIDYADEPATLAACANGKFYDVVVTDLDLLTKGGLSLLSKLRELNPSQALILLSNAPGVEPVPECLRSGAASFFCKPIDSQSLKQAISRVMEFSAAHNGTSGWLHYCTQAAAHYEFDSVQLAKERFVLPLIAELERGGKIDADTKLKLDLVISEALTNSLDHGNLELLSEWREEFDGQGIDRYSLVRKERLKDPAYAGRKIFLEAHYTPHELKIVLRDQGQGFLAASKPHAPDSCEPKMHGRGITIMNSIMDRVEYTARGTTLTLTKHLKG